jgi:hypothetical protein
MALTAGVIVALVLSVVIFFIAVGIHRRQQLLNLKRSEYLVAKRDNAAHWKRFETCQVEIDRCKSDVKMRSRDLHVMILEMDKKRNEIREILNILREESERADLEMDRELAKIVERRKMILRTHWKEMNGIKTLFIQKMKEISQFRAGIANVLSRKDDEYVKWNKTKMQMERLKREFEAVSRSSIFSFSRKQ